MPARTTLAGLPRRARMRAGAFVVDNAFRVLARAGRLHPRARPSRHDVELVRNVAYTGSGLAAHTLDVYRPKGEGPHPVVLYMHGGGFRILSKDSHWLMGLAFARRGYLVFNVNYRLAPAHPYPAALEDVIAAMRFVVREAESYGGDTSRLVLAGESAGANLATAMTVAQSFERTEPFAADLAELPSPRAVVAACGVLQVSDPERFSRRRKLPRMVQDRLDEVAEAYLHGASDERPGGLELADPLLVLEGESEPVRPLPPFLAFAGTRDPLLDDSRRLSAALRRRGADCWLRVYPGEVHAFHALLWRPNAHAAWLETYAFLEAMGCAPGDS